MELWNGCGGKHLGAYLQLKTKTKKEKKKIIIIIKIVMNI